MLSTAHGLTLHSELALPEALPASAPADTHPPDVTIVMGQVSPNGLEGGRQLGPFVWAGNEHLWLRVPGVARYQVSGGHHITIEREPNTDDDSVRAFLLGPALGGLLQQRGLVVLQGTAVRQGDGAMVLVGTSGAGKSALGAGLMQRGHDVIADDLVAIDSGGRVLPGIPRLKLWRDMVDLLGLDAATLSRLRPAIEKYSVAAPARVPGGVGALPARWIYRLGVSNRDVAIVPLQGVPRLAVLRNNLYRRRFLLGSPAEHRQFRQCGQLATQAHFAVVGRRPGHAAMQALIEQLQQDMAAHP